MTLRKGVFLAALAVFCCGLTGCGAKSPAQTCERLRKALDSIRSSEGAAYTWQSPSDMGNPYTVYTNGSDYYAVRLVDGAAVQEQIGHDGALYNRLPGEETAYTDTSSAAGDLPGLAEMEALLEPGNFARAEESGQSVTLTVSEEYLQKIKDTALTNTKALLGGMTDAALAEEALKTLELMDYTAGTFTATVQGGQITSFCWELESRQKDASGEVVAQNTETQQSILLDTPAEEVQKTLQDTFAALP